MKPSTFLAHVAVLTQAGSSLASKQENWCQQVGTGSVYIGGQPIVVQYRYNLNAYNVTEDIPTVCGRLWKELRQFWTCGVWSFTRFKHYCRQADNGLLQWEFETGLGCNMGMIEATWWDATKHKFGAAPCEKA
ncbi:uncharacterized protein CTRU02_209873 [Colletotrichum truncatum]|uniref:Uncharacterized protein n=1 Tax=Colletotrichum truncatum TaxID=5467 RepID=A0ACC3YVX6_COLTU|nr:uncharacterized protein CTRU02_02445 [Colletotrichum truncatum]KAF6798471.1 hypothetical protein CTRU02_02445 [Colletotrichum truncatum]